MSILNRPSDGLVSVMIALQRTLLAYGPLETERLLAFAAPRSVVAESKQAQQTLTRWTQLGLFTSADGVAALAPPFDHIAADDLEALRRAVVRLVISDRSAPLIAESIAEPDDTEGARRYRERSLATDFVRAACWILMQDVYDFYCRDPNWPTIEAIEVSQRANPRPIHNDTRWPGYKEWACFLGFAQSVGGRLLHAPCFAVRSVLQDVFGSEEVLPVAVFLDRLAVELPVLDGGRLRGQVEKTVEAPPYAMRERDISISLSATLLHLEQAGIVRLEARSDASTHRLLGHRARELASISHVTRGATT